MSTLEKVSRNLLSTKKILNNCNFFFLMIMATLQHFATKACENANLKKDLKNFEKSLDAYKNELMAKEVLGSNITYKSQFLRETSVTRFCDFNHLSTTI